ncbi:hypothetical protein [Microbacterium sp. H1-D42]|uniref:hypothetical protein n=1 Tax=Microbacterium sp. H1-D42 TaxID=2925844 RepID=UPI001F5314D7|nr:hypothetical protein [Microbacterium sp. H1-D42]UNK70114.1 hypothetical protein MNR00_13210 [Microbacterium sp. H1-D42]
MTIARRHSAVISAGSVAKQNGMWKRSLLILLSLGYMLLLVAGYREIVVPRYDYFNMHWAGFSLDNYVAAILFMVAMVVMLPLSCVKFGDVVSWILFYAVFVPCLVIPIASGYITQDQGVFFSLWIFVSFILLRTGHHVISQGEAIRLPSLSSKAYGAILVIAWLVIFGVFLAVSGVSLTATPFGDIYDTRAEYRANVVSQNVFMAYSVPLASKVVNPLLIVLGLRKRNFLLVGMGAVGSWLVFSANAQKSVLLTAILVPVVYLLLRKRVRIQAAVVSVAFFLLAAASTLSPALMELILRRTVMVPGLLVGMYVDNFSEHGFVHLGHSIFSGLGPSERLPPGLEVGLNYWGDPGMAANANFLGDGFANYGYLGMVIFSLILGCVLGIVDRLTKFTPFPVVVASSIGVIFALIDTALLTSLLTHGLLAITLLLALYPRDSESRLDPT